MCHAIAVGRFAVGLGPIPALLYSFRVTLGEWLSPPLGSQWEPPLGHRSAPPLLGGAAERLGESSCEAFSRPRPCNLGL